MAAVLTTAPMDSPTEPQKARHPQPRSIDLLQAALAAREDVYGDQSRTNSFASPYSPHSPISLHSPSLKSPSFADEKGISPIFPSETDLVSPTNGNKETSSSKFSRLRSYRNSIWSSKNGDEIPTGSEVPKVPELRSPTPAPEDPGPGLSKAREVLFVFNICLAQLFSLAGLAQSFAPLVILSDSFNVTDPGQMSWYTAAYSLTLGSFILPAGRLGDMFGHKRIFIIGWAWFAFWSLICGFSYAGGPIMLSACRAMQGIGPALLIPNGIALVGRRFPIGMKRNISIALFGGCGPVGIVSGAVGSSLFAQLVWWPWAFWFFAIACSVVGVLSIVAIPEDEGHAASGKSGSTNLRPKEKFDTLGAITGVSGLILINFAFNQAPLVDWSTPYIPVLMVAGILLMAVFVHVELHVAEKPLLPLRGLHRDAALTLTCIAAGWGSHGVWSYYQFLKWELYLKISPLSACSMFWPVAPVGFCAALAVPYILRKVRVPIVSHGLRKLDEDDLTNALAAYECSHVFLHVRNYPPCHRPGRAGLLAKHFHFYPHHAPCHELELSLGHDPHVECCIEAASRHCSVARHDSESCYKS